jgi:Secretion system C-terminal sorting domain
MKTIILIAAIVLFYSSMLVAQISGCTDPNANNFNSSATINDGSCTYNQSNCSPYEYINPLPSELEENSGLIFFNQHFWTHNDSGGENCIYELDSSNGQIIRKIVIDNVSNYDWEDIAQDSLFIYIGEFGNNAGDRQDLKILKLSKTDAINNDTVNAEFIRFSYADQSSFSLPYQDHNYDCEALISYGDSLFLFTKNWNDKETSIYKLPKDSGTYVLPIASQYNVDGLITAADISPNKKQIVLCGYKNYKPFIWLFWNFQANDILSGNKRRIDFPASHIGYQTEGLCFVNDEYFCISNEKSPSPLFYVQRVFLFKTTNWTDPNTFGEYVPAKDDKINIIPNPSKDYFLLKTEINECLDFSLFNNIGNTVITGTTNLSGATQIDTKDLQKGIYYLLLHSNYHPCCRKVIIL